MLGNLNGQAPRALAPKLAALGLGERVVLPSERKEVPVDSKLFDGYTGRYELTPSAIMAVTREGDHLFTQLTGQPRIEIFPESPRDYFVKVKVVDARRLLL